MNQSRTVVQIQADLDQEEKLMYIHQKNGNYTDAEKSRLKIGQLQKDHEARSLYQLKNRHKYQQKNLLSSNKEEFARFNDYWNSRETQIQQEEEKMQAQMLKRHKAELLETRNELQNTLSPRVKESSELLNLRKMQEHMKRQKNYAEAHIVQQQIFEMQKGEKVVWLQKRDERIQIALKTLKEKQIVQLAILKKRYKTLLDQSVIERKLEEQKLMLKHNNLQSDLKSQQQKEILNQKGQFRSKGGKESPMRTRSNFYN